MRSKVSVPEDSVNRNFRCPVCKAGIALSQVPNCWAATPLAAASAGRDLPRMPKCDRRRRGGRSLVRNVSKFIITSAGSKSADAELTAASKLRKRRKTAAEQPLSAWGDTKVCPVCKETIKAIAVKCRYCGSDFDTVDPLTLRDVLRKDKRRESAKGFRKTIVALFVLSLIGCLGSHNRHREPVRHFAETEGIGERRARLFGVRLFGDGHFRVILDIDAAFCD